MPAAFVSKNNASSVSVARAVEPAVEMVTVDGGGAPSPEPMGSAAMTLPTAAIASDGPVARATSRIARALDRSCAPVVTCSMQLGGLVLVHLVRSHIPDIPVVFIDTGYHFPESLAFRDQVAESWDLNLIVAAPAVSVSRHEATLGVLYTSHPDQCCALRKIAPAETALVGHDVWFAAVRRSQAETRKGLAAVMTYRMSDGGTIPKVHPLVDWSWADVDHYATAHGIPRHPLYERGFTSIGCWPCTAPTFGEGDDRSGRWGGQDMTECGLHTAGPM